MQVTSDIVSPIRTITAPLACLASRPVSRLMSLSPMVRSTTLRAKGVLDMETTYEAALWRREREGWGIGPGAGIEADRSLAPCTFRGTDEQAERSVRTIPSRPDRDRPGSPGLASACLLEEAPG